MSKSCIVIRHGAFGDAIMASCVLPYLKADGYEITMYTNNNGLTVLDGNPNIDHFAEHIDNSVQLGTLLEYYESISEKYDRVVNLTGSIENIALFAYPQPLYLESLRRRRDVAGKQNYWDNQLLKAGYEINGKRPVADIHFYPEEEEKGEAWAKKHEGKFKIVYCLSGSSVHKVYRYFEKLMTSFLEKHDDALLFTVGSYQTKLLTFTHDRVYNTMFWEMPFRESMLLAKYADLVMGPETGIVNAASCWPDVAKIVLLSHSGPQNLTKHWENTYALQAPCHCSPCYLLHKYRWIWQQKCEVDDTLITATPRCCEHGAGDILDIMEVIYDRWKTTQI